MLPPLYEQKELTDIINFILNENSERTKPPDIVKHNPHFLRVRGLLEFAKGYDFDNDPPLIVLAGNVDTLGIRIASIEKVLAPPPEATQQLENKTNTTLANEHHR